MNLLPSVPGAWGGARRISGGGGGKGEWPLHLKQKFSKSQYSIPESSVIDHTVLQTDLIKKPRIFSTPGELSVGHS